MIEEESGTFKIVFFGVIQGSQEKEWVKERFAKAFNIKDSQILEHIFSGAMTVLKRGLSRADATKYEQTINKLGADCSVEPDSALGQFEGKDKAYQRKKKRLMSSLAPKDLSDIEIEPKV